VTAGGAGKTPTAIAVTRFLVDAGLRVAILSRGYGRTGRGEAGIVDAADPARFGDEPVVLHETLPDAEVIVGSDRWEAGRRYLEDHDCDVFVLDDGFQHLQLARDLDLVLDVDARGWLRESRDALKWAGAILTRGREADSRFDRPTFRAELVPESIVVGGDTHPPDWIRGRPVVAFSGLADNTQFFRSLSSLGADLHAMRGFPDHHRYTSRDLTDLFDLVRHVPDAVLVTTRKDEVKLPSMGAAVLRVRMSIEPADAMKALLLETVDAARRR